MTLLHSESVRIYYAYPESASRTLPNGVISVFMPEANPFVPKQSPDTAQRRDEASRIEQIGQRLATEVRLFVRTLPIPARGVRGMAEFLGVDRNLCQRVLAASKLDGLGFLLQTPSPAQLQRLVEGATLKGVDPDRLLGLRAAVETFSSLVIEGERAPGAFRRRVRALMLPATAEKQTADEASPFAALHRASVDVAGSELEARINVGLMWPMPQTRLGVNVLMIQGHVGYSARTGGMPMVAQFADWDSDAQGRPIAETLVSATGRDAKRVLLREFCSEPAPSMVASGTPASGEHVLEPGMLAAGQKATVFTAVSVVQDPHPLLDPEDRIRSFNAHMRLPSRRFLFDIFLHRSLASACVPGCSAQAWSPNLHINPLTDWANAIPGGVRLEILGSDPRHLASDAWDRHGEVVRRAFAIAGCSPTDFIGHRMDVRMPVWGAHYVISFDFSHAPQLDL